MKAWLAVLVAAVVLRPLAAKETQAGSGLERALAVVRAAGPNGQGSREAARAWRTLAAADVGQLPRLLAGMDGAGPLAHNWLRSAIDRVLERARCRKKPLPYKELEAFLRDRRHDPQARRFVYELLLEHDKTTADRFLPHMLDDPSLELRRDAVARLLDQAKKLLADKQKEKALPLFQKALVAARDLDQVVAVTQQLRTLGKPVDLPTHLGLVLEWKVIGPFDNPDQKGMATVHPPETKTDLTAAYAGKTGKVHWKDYLSKDERGLVDLNAAVGKHTEAVAYARAEFTSARPRGVEIRIGCYTPFKLWVNGRLLLDRGDAYTGMRLDHYVTRARLKAGKNVFLMKVAQDKPPSYIPQLWQFQLRVCDATGAAVLSTTRPARPAAEKKS
jgi:hypothetical protein